MTTVHNDAKTTLAAITVDTPLGGASSKALSGEILTGTQQVFAAEDGSVSTGYWISEPGLEEWTMDGYGEIIYVLSGSMEVLEEGATEPIVVGAGESAVFPKGWHGTWNITSTLSKFYIVFH